MLLDVSPEMKLRKNKVRFTPYASDEALPIMGKVKLVLKNLNQKKVKCMVYVVKGGKECLLGRRDGEALGVINIHPRGHTPEESPDIKVSAKGNQKGHLRKNKEGFSRSLPSHQDTEEDLDQEQDVSRLEMVHQPPSTDKHTLDQEK